MSTIDNFLHELSTTDPETILKWRTYYKHEVESKENHLKVAKNCAEKNVYFDEQHRDFYNLANAHKELDFAKFYLFRVEQEIEKRKLTFMKNEINVKENHGIIQQGNNNTANQNLTEINSHNISNPLPNPTNRPLMQILKWVGAVLTGLVIAYITYIMGWAGDN